MEVKHLEPKEGNNEVCFECDARHSPDKRQPEAVGQVAYRQMSPPGVRCPPDDGSPALVVPGIGGPGPDDVGRGRLPPAMAVVHCLPARVVAGNKHAWRHTAQRATVRCPRCRALNAGGTTVCAHH